MSVVNFPCYSFNDPRSGLTVHMEAQRYKRVVRFDVTMGLLRIVKENSAERYATPAQVIRFPIEQTRALGAL